MCIVYRDHGSVYLTVFSLLYTAVSYTHLDVYKRQTMAYRPQWSRTVVSPTLMQNKKLITTDNS